MKLGPLIAALVGVVVPALVALNAATFSYVVQVERRLTRIETLLGQPMPAGREQVRETKL